MKKKQILIRVRGGLIEMEPQTWPKQAAFSLYSKFVKELIRQNNLGLGFPISGDSKQSLGLG